MKNELIIFAAAIALLAGCSKEEGAPAAERPCIRLSTGVEAATRATDVAFEEGDNFGLIVLSRTSETAPSLDGARYLNNGLCTQTAEGVEMPTVKYPEKSADFYAYYPYREEFTAGSSFIQALHFASLAVQPPQGDTARRPPVHPGQVQPSVRRGVLGGGGAQLVRIVLDVQIDLKSWVVRHQHGGVRLKQGPNV